MTVPATGSAAELLARGRAALRRGDYPAAAAAFEAARRASPDAIEPVHLLAGVRHALGEHEAAEALLEDAVARAPDAPGLWYSLGLVRHAAGRYRGARSAYQRALDLAPGWADALAGRGKVRQLLNDLTGARQDFRAALAASPGHADALGGLAAALELDGEPGQARALLEPVVEAGRAPAGLVIAWARLAGHAGAAEPAEQTLRRLLEVTTLADHERSHALFALGDLLDRRDACDEAFEAWAQANRSKPGTFDGEAWAAEVSAICRDWTRAALAGLPPGSASERPLFIVGMPRSGTTLVEQILAAHPAVHAGGELEALAGLARTLGEPPRPAALDAGTSAALAGRYLTLAGGSAAAHRVTDKMPSNFRHLGLIRALFPRARIVHCRRDPRDVALSCFRQDFGGLGLAWTRELTSIGAYYAGYHRLMAHWEATLDDGMLTLDYEDLVADPEAGARRLLQHAGLAWDSACLDAHALARVAATASHAQVRRPVYADAVGRYRRYARQLAALDPWLAPADE
jgi:tetratricopeptide (TPR) repeat protein